MLRSISSTLCGCQRWMGGGLFSPGLISIRDASCIRESAELISGFGLGGCFAFHTFFAALAAITQSHTDFHHKTEKFVFILDHILKKLGLIQHRSTMHKGPGGAVVKIGR